MRSYSSQKIANKQRTTSDNLQKICTLLQITSFTTVLRLPFVITEAKEANLCDRNCCFSINILAAFDSLLIFSFVHLSCSYALNLNRCYTSFRLISNKKNITGFVFILHQCHTTNITSIRNFFLAITVLSQLSFI